MWLTQKGRVGTVTGDYLWIIEGWDLAGRLTGNCFRYCVRMMWDVKSRGK